MFLSPLFDSKERSRKRNASALIKIKHRMKHSEILDPGRFRLNWPFSCISVR